MATPEPRPGADLGVALATQIRLQRALAAQLERLARALRDGVPGAIAAAAAAVADAADEARRAEERLAAALAALPGSPASVPDALPLLAKATERDRAAALLDALRGAARDVATARRQVGSLADALFATTHQTIAALRLLEQSEGGYQVDGTVRADPPRRHLVDQSA